MSCTAEDAAEVCATEIESGGCCFGFEVAESGSAPDSVGTVHTGCEFKETLDELEA